eukprot:s2763_g14.t1
MGPGNCIVMPFCVTLGFVILFFESLIAPMSALEYAVKGPVVRLLARLIGNMLASMLARIWTFAALYLEMDQLQFLQAFGVDVAKGGHILIQRRTVMQEILLKGSRKREDIKKQIICLLLDLWRLRALPRDAVDSMARTVELVVKSMFRQQTIPSIDWKKLVQEAFRKFDSPDADKENVNCRSRCPRRNSHLRVGHRHDSRSPLPRRIDPSAARSKSMAKPGARIALMNTEQKALCRQSGELLETPRGSCAPTVPDSDAEIEVPPRQLFPSPDTGHGSLPPDTLQIVPCIGQKFPDMHGSDSLHRDTLVAAALAPDAPKAFSKFSQHRMKWPPYEPHEITRAQLQPCSSETGEDCLDFVFHCSEVIRLDKLYLFYRELAKAGIYVDVLYWGSSFAKLINSQGYKGSEAVPAVTTRLGPSINYHISTSGRIRLDGKMDQKEVLAAMLRRVFPPFDGTQLKNNASAVQRHLVDGRQLQDWIAQRHGKCLRVESSCLFDGFGVQGLWDKLNMAVGVRGVPANTAIPWIILTRTQVCIAVWPTGKIQVSPGKSSVTAIEAVEATLVNHFNAKWVPVDAFKQLSASVVTYGVLSETARQQTKLFG